MGRGLVTDGVIVATVPSIILFMTYAYRLGRAVAFGNPTAAITLNASVVLNTFMDLLHVFWWQILVSLGIGFVIAAVIFPSLRIIIRALIAVISAGIIIPLTSTVPGVFDPYAILIVFCTLGAALALPVFMVALRWRRRHPDAKEEWLGESRRYEDFGEMVTRIERLGPLDLDELPTLGDLVLDRG